MSTIIAFSGQTPGHMFPFVPILVELMRRGHQARFAVVSANVGEIGKIGEIASIPVLGMPWTMRSEPGSRSDVWAPYLTAYSAHGEPVAEILDRLLEREHPDLLLIDPMLWGGMVAAEACGIPWASVAHNPLFFRGCGLDVRGPGLMPPQNLFGRIRHRVAASRIRRVDARFLPTMNAVRASRGLPPISNLSAALLRPPLILATTAEPFEYPRSDWPPFLRFVGPMMWDPPGQSPALPVDLDERPLVLLTGSSIREVGRAEAWIRVALEALAEEPYQVIATVPADQIPGRLPSNVQVHHSAPHGPLLARACCVICHAGPGITHKALAAGVPVVAIPFAFDRFEVARRVEVAGAGVRLPGSELTAERLKQAVRRAIDCKPGAERIALAFRNAPGPTGAADAVESLLEAYSADREVPLGIGPMCRQSVPWAVKS